VIRLNGFVYMTWTRSEQVCLYGLAPTWTR